MSNTVSQHILRLSTGGGRSSLKSRTSNLSQGSRTSTSIENEEITDESRLYNAVREAGRYADGIDAVEVWMLEDLHLVQPEGGWYRDPSFEAVDQDALDRIENKQRDDYVSPPPQLPGTGLAGGLWTTGQEEHPHTHFSVFPWARDDYNDDDVLRPDEPLDRQNSRRTAFGLPALISRSSKPPRSKIFARFSHDDKEDAADQDIKSSRHAAVSTRRRGSAPSVAISGSTSPAGSGLFARNSRRAVVNGSPVPNPSKHKSGKDGRGELDLSRVPAPQKDLDPESQSQDGETELPSNPAGTGSIDDSYGPPRFDNKNDIPLARPNSLISNRRPSGGLMPRSSTLRDSGQPLANDDPAVPAVAEKSATNNQSEQTKPGSGDEPALTALDQWRSESRNHESHGEAEPKNPRLEIKTAFRSFGASFRRSSMRRGSLSFRRRESSASMGRRGSDIYWAPAEQDMLWRDIRSLTMDPDQPTFLRLKLLEEAGFGKATGVRFEFRGQKGIVLFLAKASTREEILNSTDNCAYMKSAADLVGAAACLSKMKKAVLARKATPAIHETVVHNQRTKEDGKFVRSLKNYAGKLKGGDLQPPPRMSSRQSLLTFFGALLTLLVLAFISESINAGSDGRYLILLGPFGALMTLQYGLTMAPASQPRNALFGQAIAVSIAMATTYIPESVMALWIRVPLASAAAIASMTRLGITHPPAGAAALIISSGGFDWMVLPLILLGNVVALITATLINNLTDKRQYPTYLHLCIPCPFGDMFGSSSSQDKQEKNASEKKPLDHTNKGSLTSVTKAQLDEESEPSIVSNV